MSLPVAWLRGAARVSLEIIMLFRRLIVNAICVGFVAGLLMSFVQILAVNPIILAAESFEPSGAVEQQVGPASDPAAQTDTDAHGQAGHHHSGDAWSPAEGAERVLMTVLSNVLAGIGFAALVLALMSQLQLQGIAQMSVVKGLAWGIAGFLAFFLAPGLGIPPEIPGAQSASVGSRQLWWVLVVLGVSTGLLLLAYAPAKWKALGLGCIVAPAFLTIPHGDGPMFSHPDPTVVESLMTLHRQFFMASGITNLVFWLALGAFCGWALNRWVLASPMQPSRTTV